MAMTPEKLRQYTEALMARAERDLGEAESNLDAGSYNVASSQSYYCMHGAATALLASRNLDLRRAPDPEVVAMFTYNFVSTGDMIAKFGEYFKAAFKSRIACGYDASYNETPENARDLLAKAGEFLKAAGTRLEEELKKLELPDIRKASEG